MRMLVRRASLVLAAVLVTAAIAPGALAGGVPSARDRVFRPRPVPAPTGTQQTIEATGLHVRPLRNGRIVWRAEESMPTLDLSAPTQVSGFDAIPRIGPNWPADPTGALGRSVFLTAVNSSFAMYTRSGLAALGPEPLAGLFRLPRGTRVLDPKVVYDQYDERFVLAFLGVNDRLQRSWFLIVAIPDRTPGHIDTWCGAMVPGDRTAGDGRQFPDSLGLGYDRHHVVVTSNQFDFRSEVFRGAQVTAARKRDLYDCDRALKLSTFAEGRTLNPDGSPAFAIQPATTVGSGNLLYLVSFDAGLPNFVVLWRLKELDGRLTLQNTSLKVRPVGIGPFATQGGGTLDASNTWWDPGDLRLTSAFADLLRSSVYGAHVVAGDLRPDPLTGGYAEAVIRWYEIHVRPKLSRSVVTRTGTIGAPEADVGWPAIGTDAAGNVLVTYSRASAPRAEFLSAWVARIAPGATASSSVVLASGSARVEAMPGPERWGSYAALSRDPEDPSLIAIVNQYALDDGEGTTLDWQQTIQVVGDL